MRISETIRRLREERGLKQADIAKKLNLEPSNYNRLEKRDTKLTVEQLSAIADGLGVSVGELLGIEGNAKNDNSEELKKEINSLKQELTTLKANNKAVLDLNARLLEEQESIKGFLDLAKEDRDAFIEALDSTLELSNSNSVWIALGIAIALAGKKDNL